MEDEINHLLSRAESKFCTPNGSRCTSKTIGLLVRRHIVAGEFHYIGKEASTRWTGGPDFSMMAEAGVLDATDETCREYERVVELKYLQEIRAAAKEFSTKCLSRKAGLAECSIRNFKRGKNTIMTNLTALSKSTFSRKKHQIVTSKTQRMTKVRWRDVCLDAFLVGMVVTSVVGLVYVFTRH